MLRSWATDFRERGVALVLATHALEVGVDLCQRGVVLEGGQARWRGPANGVIAEMGGGV